MKKLLYALTILSCLGWSACSTPEFVPERDPAIKVVKVSGELTYGIVPFGDEAGTVVVQTGDEVKVEGFNLTAVRNITLNGMDVEIIELGMSSLRFLIPDLGLAQSDEPHKVELLAYSIHQSEPFFRVDYYVTKPVTDARAGEFSPASGTYGTALRLEGRNLDKVTAVSVAGVTVASDAFLEHSASVITLTLPAIKGTVDESVCEIVMKWEGGDIVVTDAENTFTYLRPVFEAPTWEEPLAIGDEITLKGKNLDLIKAYRWDKYEFPVVEMTAKEQVVLKVPAAIEKTDPVVATADLTADWGSPAVSLEVKKGLKIDTKPLGPAKPVFISIADQEGSKYPNLYLGHTVVVKGENMSTAEAFYVDGMRADVVSANDVEARFVIPAGITGTSAKEVSLQVQYGGGNQVDLATIKIYPFFCTKGLKIGVGSNSSSTYHENGRTYSFLMLDEDRVISAEQWVEQSVDPFAKAMSSNAMIASAGKSTPGRSADYYAVKPYTLLTSSSANKLAFQNPANSASQLKNHRYPGNTAVSSTFGTPVVFFGIVKISDARTALLDGSLEDILAYSAMAGSNAPAFGAEDDGSGAALSEGSVLMFQYLKYEHTSTTGGKAAEREDVAVQGYLVIRSVSCTDAAGATVADRSGFVEFDFYRSNPL